MYSVAYRRLRGLTALPLPARKILLEGSKSVGSKLPRAKAPPIVDVLPSLKAEDSWIKRRMPTFIGLPPALLDG